jgi:2-methylisocitrate lyase-like PEP mutase family enzyme
VYERLVDGLLLSAGADVVLANSATDEAQFRSVFKAVGARSPVIGAGIALNQGASASDTVLGSAIVVALGVSVSGWALLGRQPRTA